VCVLGRFAWKTASSLNSDYFLFLLYEKIIAGKMGNRMWGGVFSWHIEDKNSPSSQMHHWDLKKSVFMFY